MDQQIGTEQKARDVAAPLEKLDHAGNTQRLGLQLERLGVVLTDHQQPGALAQFARQRRQGLEAAVDPLGLEAGTDLHQQQLVGPHFELLAELGADLRGIGRRAAILGNARRQQVKAFSGRAVVLDEQRLLHLGDHQDFGLRLRREHCALVLGEVLVAAPAPIDRVAQRLRLVLEARVGGVVHVQPRHLVEADHPVHRPLGQIGLDPGGEALVAGVVEQRLDRRDQHFEAVRHLAFPDHRVDANAVPATLAFQGDTHEIALQTTEWKVLVENEGQLHQTDSGARSRAFSSVTTRSGSRSSKQGLCRSPRPAFGPLAHRCTWERP